MDYRHPSSTVSNLFRTLLRGSSSEFVGQRTSLTRSSAYTGYAFLSASPSNWPSWHTAPSTPPHLHICSPVSLVLSTWRQDRARLRSSASQRLAVLLVRLNTVDRRAFPVSGDVVWNSLPPHVTSAASLAIFRQRLKTFLVTKSYPNIHISFDFLQWTLQ